VVNLALKAKHVNINGTVSVGVRVPNSRFCLDVLHDFGKPIAATSVNISGEKPAVLFTDIAENIVQNVDYVTEGNAKYSGSGVPSTIVKISDGNVSFLRKGENYILISEKLSVI
jgi:L-threonylcarbamoyladenylate synthase